MFSSEFLPVYGVYKRSEDEVTNLVQSAVECGATRIDTAQLYKNEQSVKDSGADVRVTTKIHWKVAKKGPDAVLSAIRERVDLFGDMLDCILLHHPTDNFEQLWERMLMDVCRDNVPRLGVSNFSREQLGRIDGVDAHQFEMSAFCPRDEMVRYCHERKIEPQAHTVFSRGDLHGVNVLQALGYVMSRGVVPVVGAVDQKQLQEIYSVKNKSFSEPVPASSVYKCHFHWFNDEYTAQ